MQFLNELLNKFPKDILEKFSEKMQRNLKSNSLWNTQWNFQRNLRSKPRSNCSLEPGAIPEKVAYGIPNSILENIPEKKSTWNTPERISAERTPERIPGVSEGIATLRIPEEAPTGEVTKGIHRKNSYSRNAGRSPCSKNSRKNFCSLNPGKVSCWNFFEESLKKCLEKFQKYELLVDSLPEEISTLSREQLKMSLVQLQLC